MSDDITRLILDRKKWPDIDMDLAVSCISSRRKLKGKVQEWYDNAELIFPAALSAEQCSSSATALYKASLAEHIVTASEDKESFRIADLTGGLGVDSWFFSKKASQVLYNEMQEALCNAAAYNFRILGAGNITISNHAVVPSGKDVSPAASEDTVHASHEGLEISPALLLEDFSPDIIFMDPARRGEGGKKVFLIEECTPDVLTLKAGLFAISRHLLIKLSPMADISMVCERLGKCCREVHVVAAGGECKELLIWMDREWCGEYGITAVELHNDGTADSFSFTPSEERSGTASAPYQCTIRNTAYSNDNDGNRCPSECYIFEPGKALMKAGAFNTVATRFGLNKLGVSTHYYITDDPAKAAELKKYGKVFRIIDSMPLDKRTVKETGKRFPHSEVTARNIPMDTDTLRKKLGVTSGDDAHIFGLKSDTDGNILLVTVRI